MLCGLTVTGASYAGGFVVLVFIVCIGDCLVVLRWADGALIWWVSYGLVFAGLVGVPGFVGSGLGGSGLAVVLGWWWCWVGGGSGLAVVLGWRGAGLAGVLGLAGSVLFDHS